MTNVSGRTVVRISIVNSKLYSTGVRVLAIFFFLESSFTWASGVLFFLRSTLRYCPHLRSSFGVQLMAKILISLHVAFGTPTTARIARGHVGLLLTGWGSWFEIGTRRIRPLFITFGTSGYGTICFSTCVGGASWVLGGSVGSCILEPMAWRIMWASCSKRCQETSSSFERMLVDCLMDLPLLGWAALLARLPTSSLLSSLTLVKLSLWRQMVRRVPWFTSTHHDQFSNRCVGFLCAPHPNNTNCF